MNLKQRLDRLEKMTPRATADLPDAAGMPDVTKMSNEELVAAIAGGAGKYGPLPQPSDEELRRMIDQWDGPFVTGATGIGAQNPVPTVPTVPSSTSAASSRALRPRLAVWRRAGA